MAGKTYTVEEKYNIIFESLSTNHAITEICRKHGISPSTYQIWKDQFITGARSGLKVNPEKVHTRNRLRISKPQLQISPKQTML
ncbi:MAG: transposase [Thermoplasmataceae archaeon]